MTDSQIDRNLLFAVLAFQDDLIDRDQFVDVCSGWAARIHVPIADLLRERGWITAEDARAVHARLDRKVKKHAGDVRASLGAVADSDARDLIRQTDHPVLRASLAGLMPAAGYVRIETLVKPAEHRSRYTLTRVYGEGALGKVWAARDGDLNREVALKEIHPSHASNPDAWRRFFKEAQVTGQLQHPNIVPVYELSCRTEDEQPFYTMKLVRGRTLRARIAEYHARHGPGATDPLERQKLLGALIAVCQAIGYAHSRGIVHRDLKPENVVVGDFDEVVVLDWGLAKLIDQPEEVETEPKITVTGEAAEVQTRGTLGTPAYMAPEQAESRLDQVDDRTDIYGLGTILFEILTGRPPHEGKDFDDLIARILSGDSPRARNLLPLVPPALDAICARAMAKSRAARYAKATELAEDVKRWIADEPVSVYRDPVMTRISRWGRRHRQAVGAASALLAITVLALATGIVLINRERARADAERALAVRNLTIAADAAEGMLSEVGDVDLAEIPQMEPVREKLLKKAETSYTELMTQKTSRDPKMRGLAARTLGRLADVQEMLGSFAAAAKSYKTAIDQLGRLADEDPKQPTVRRDLARASHGLGILLKRANRFRESEDAFRRAIALRERLAADYPADSADRGALIDSRYHLAALLARFPRRRPEEIRAYRTAIDDQRQLAALEPARPESRVKLGRYLNNLGILLSGDDHPDEAAVAYRQAIRIQEDLHRDARTLPGPRWHWARGANNLGQIFFADGERELRRKQAEARKRFLEQSFEQYEQARKLLVALREEYPSIPQYQEELATVLRNLGVVHEAAARPADALRVYRDAASLLKSLATRFPDVPDYQQKYAVVLFDLNLLVMRDDPARAMPALHEAQATQERLIAKYPDVSDYAKSLGRNLYRRARVELARHDPKAAQETLRQAIQHHRAALALWPENPTYRRYVYDDEGVLAHTLVALRLYNDAAGAAEQLAELLPGEINAYRDAATILIGCKSAAHHDDQLTEARRRELGIDLDRRAVRILGLAISRKVIDQPSQLDFPEFDSLRTRADFQKLLDTLAKRGPADAG